MLVVMTALAGREEIDRVCRRIESLGFKPHIIPGEQRTAIGITGNSGPIDAAEFEALARDVGAVLLRVDTANATRTKLERNLMPRLGQAHRRRGGP